MKKSIVLLAILLISCAPQVTVTSEVTVTLTPLPTAMETPDPPTHTATPTGETVTLNGVTFTLGEENADGSMPVTEMKVEGNYTNEQIAEKLNTVDPLAWGFEPGEVEHIFVGDYLEIVAAGDHSQVLAEWNYGKNEYVWNWNVMEDFEGGNPIFNIAKVWKMKGVNPDNMDEARADSTKVFDACTMLPVESKTETIQAVYIYNSSRDVAIGGFLLSPKNITEPKDAEKGDVVGRLCFIDNGRGVVHMRVRNFSFDIRYWN